ncbi:hypothetical protein HHI36_006923 [Cryptolaemus montrouzieri]|uniref:RRM domain-containing protein n=1 Tax=Cryptolaemus montrouzieri TaxID=559131 RepID=A0ABD2MN79_9CUCU
MAYSNITSFLLQVKLEQNVGKPSRVIHIRNIPNDVTEAEIIHLGIPFGRVTNVLVLKGKNQAFLEMGDEVSATTMVNYFSSCMAQLRGRAVYVQYSNHKELKTDQTHSNAVSHVFDLKVSSHDVNLLARPQGDSWIRCTRTVKDSLNVTITPQQI